MKKCADCDAENPDDATTCRACHRASFIRPKPRPPNSALMNIRIAWIAGVISASGMLIVSLLPLFGITVGRFTMAGIWLNTLHALLMGALAFGVASKSRVCAVVLFGWFLYAKVVLFLQHGFFLSGGWTGLIFLYCYLLGIIGTFEWHKQQRQEPNTALEPTATAPSVSDKP